MNPTPNNFKHWSPRNFQVTPVWVVSSVGRAAILNQLGRRFESCTTSFHAKKRPKALFCYSGISLNFDLPDDISAFRVNNPTRRNKTRGIRIPYVIRVIFSTIRLSCLVYKQHADNMNIIVGFTASKRDGKMM